MLVPSLVAVQQQRAAETGFEFSSDDGTGQLLAVLSAAVRQGGRILEIGTGMGVGLAWIASGLGPRTDVSVTTIEHDTDRSALAQDGKWPPWIDFVVGDATNLLPHLGSFDLIFADAEGGKWHGLDLTIEALKPGGILLLDDLVPQNWKTGADKAAHAQKIEEIREQISGDSRLIAAEMNHASGLLLACRRSSE